MGDIDIETSQWLNTLKLGQNIAYVSDFQNGYYLGVIFQRLNLAKGRKFRNSHDMACKFQNYKNVRDLLYQNFKVQFPIQNILYSTGELLIALRDAIKKYNKDKKEATLRKIQATSESKIQPHEEKMFASRQKDILSMSKFNQTGKLPKKIQEIEYKLEKYKEIKTKHQLLALEDRKRQIQGNRRAIEEHRLYELNKVRTNHEFMKEHQRKVFDVWLKTEQIKKQRIQKDNNLKTFLQEKSNKFYKSLRMQEVKSFNDGLDAFQLNCIRQGIDLQHDPDRPKTKPEEHFNKKVFMQRIKDNIKIHDHERKERLKRQNKKNVDVKQANIKSQQIWNENNLVQDYAKKISSHLQICRKIEKTMNNQLAQKKVIQQKSKNKTFTQLPSTNIDEQARQLQHNQRKRQYLDETIVRLERRQKKHKVIAETILDALVNVVIYNEDTYQKNKGFNASEWKAIQKDFMKYQKNMKKLKDQSRFIDSSYQKLTQQYISNTGQWTVSKNGVIKQNYKISNILQKLIDTAFPPKQEPQKSDVPLYMPLKISFVGNKLSGKTTLSQKISNKYGVLIINPVTIISQAFELNKEPVAEDPKKKKDSKKPEQQNPQKTALKQWGQKLMTKIQNLQQATVQHYIQAIVFKLKFNYQNKKGEEILKQFQESKIEEAQRLSKALKEFQQFQKKGKKDPKKGAAEISEEPPSERKYFYTKGFILDGINLNIQTLKQIEFKLNGYLSFQEKINHRAQQTKQLISNIIEVPQAQKDNKLKPSTFDLLFQLNASEEALEKRQNQKTQLAPINFQEIKSYYSNFGIEEHKFNVYQQIVNQQSVQDGVLSVSKVIQSYLDIKYQQIKKISNQQQGVHNNTQSANTIFSFINFSRDQSQRFVNLLSNVYKQYFTKISLSFSDYGKLRQQFSNNLVHIQNNFISIINRPDDKAGKILNFQQNYNRLLTQKNNIVKDAEASKHLISKLDELNDSLWVSLQGKKNEAVLQRQKVLNSNFLEKQVEKVIEISKVILQNELNLLVEIIFFIYNLNNAASGRKDHINTEYLVLGIPPQLQPIHSFELSNLASDRLDYYSNQTKKCIAQLQSWLKKKQKKFKIVKSQNYDSILQDFIQRRVQAINQRIGQISSKTKEIYLQYFCFYKALTNKMDDWIIQGIKYENDFVYQIYKNIKKNINQAKKSNIKDLYVREITEILKPISALPANRLPVVVQTPLCKFKILSFTIFMQQIKCLSSVGKIPFKNFQAYINKRKKSSLLQRQFLNLELDIMQQYLVTDEYCNYKEVCLAILLWKTKILEEDSINEYEKLLQGKPESQNVTDFDYYKQELSLDEFKLIPGVTTDIVQEKVLKKYVFEIFRQEFKDKIVINDYIDVLRLFSQLQVQRYGDTVMMLNESGTPLLESS